MHGIHIQKVSPNHWKQLQAIGRQTFEQTFAAGNTAENLAKYLEEGFADDKMVAELNDPHASFYFAMLGEQVIGYLKLNTGPSQTELQDEKSTEIERIYVLQSHHGSGVGQLLYDHAMQIAQENGSDYIWLGVWEENPRAIHFYQKQGFVEFDKHIFKLGDDQQTDIMMKLKLQR